MAEDATPATPTPDRVSRPPQAVLDVSPPLHQQAPGANGATPPALPATSLQTLLTDPRAHGRGNGPVRAAAALQMQRTVGNRALQRMLQRSAAPVGNPQGLRGAAQVQMESAFGADFSDVTVHEGGEAAAIGARAYTHGSAIHFAPGEYAPESAGGQELLGHELAHVVQQRAGRVPTPQAGGMVANIDPGLEAEATQMGNQAARGEAVATAGQGAVPTEASGQVVQPELTAKLKEVLAEISTQHPEIPLVLLETFFKDLSEEQQKALTHQRGWFAKVFDKVTLDADKNSTKDSQLQAARIQAVLEHFRANDTDPDAVAIAPPPLRVAQQGLQGQDKANELDLLTRLGKEENMNPNFDWDKDLRMKNENMQDYELISGDDPGFNCIGLSLGHSGNDGELAKKNVEPRMGSAAHPLGPMDLLYARQGYQRSNGLDFAFDASKQKVIVYGTKDKDGNIESVGHAAIQDTRGRWQHKLGDSAAISVAGPEDISQYGPPLAVYERARPPRNAQQ